MLYFTFSYLDQISLTWEISRTRWRSQLKHFDHFETVTSDWWMKQTQMFCSSKCRNNMLRLARTTIFPYSINVLISEMFTWNIFWSLRYYDLSDVLGSLKNQLKYFHQSCRLHPRVLKFRNDFDEIILRWEWKCWTAAARIFVVCLKAESTLLQMFLITARSRFWTSWTYLTCSMMKMMVMRWWSGINNVLVLGILPPSPGRNSSFLCWVIGEFL